MMNPRRKHMLMHKLICLSQLLVENLDELQVATEPMLKYKEDLILFSEKLLESISNTETVQKTNYINDITFKIDTILRKNFIES